MLLLGCIADDFTGATDLANNLVRAGMRVVQTIGVPGAEDGPPPADAQAVVIALKSRTVPAAQAVASALQALAWLRAHGAAQIYFKVCSTFDSTDHGNIGPVAEALADALQAPVVPVCPAFPEAGRTVFKGHLFVGDLLLSDSPMRHHPLTPMADAHLVRVLQRQSRGAVGGVTHDALRQGPAAVRQRLDALAAAGTRLAVVDAIDNADLLTLGQAAVGLPLLVAGSGVAIGLPPTHGLAPSAQAAALPATPGPRAIVSGSCSAATNAQVAHCLAHGGAGFQIDP
ncbi:3-oxo-tetronate kinase, partial [Ideonella livida]